MSKVIDKTKTWVGSSLNEIYDKYGRWDYIADPIISSSSHSVFYELNSVDLKDPPKPIESSKKLCWENDHVRMPFSEQNLFEFKMADGTSFQKPTWEIIKETLQQPIKNSKELEAAIGTYNNKLPKFTVLHYFLESFLDAEKSQHFFEKVLPGIINLALQLPQLIQKNIPLLKQGTYKSISLTQLQIASLLANAFLCTFPWHKDVAASYPGINFITLFSSVNRPKRRDAIANKLKCICHYFEKVLSKRPFGVVTFERKSLPESSFPQWNKEEGFLGNTKIHVCSKGRIEDATGLLQVDFADKNIGGLVLSFGCVQEEIRFVICPELIVSCLFTERLNSNEAVLFIGSERHSTYEGYGNSFKWSGDFHDQTPYDGYGRRRTNIVAIDATKFRKSIDQFSQPMILRELNKAYVGFYSAYDKPLPAVATGNWGCGVFRGNPFLKSLIQLMACCATKRDMVYYTFGKKDLRDSLHQMHNFLASNKITIAMLWKYSCSFSSSSSKLSGDHLFSYIQQTHNNTNKQLPIQAKIPEEASTSSTLSKLHSLKRTSKQMDPSEVEGGISKKSSKTNLKKKSSLKKLN